MSILSDALADLSKYRSRDGRCGGIRLPNQEIAVKKQNMHMMVPVVLLALFCVAGVLTPAAKAVANAAPMVGADVAWMIVATALVLLMTPGLAFFYGGMVRT